MKVINWLFGSFFRTIGRTIAILLMGGLLYYIFASNGVGIKDLFLDNVKATSLYDNRYMDHMKLKFDGTTNDMVYTDDGFFTRSIALNSQTGLQKTLWIDFDSVSFPSNAKTMSFTLKVKNNSTQTNDITLFDNQYSCDIASTEYSFYQGSNGDSVSDYDHEYKPTSFTCQGRYVMGSETINEFRFGVHVAYTYGNNDWLYSPCYAQGQAGYNLTFVCPIIPDNADGFKIGISTNQEMLLTLGLYPLLTFDKDNIETVIEKQQETNDAITNQTQQQQQQHQEMMNSTTTEAENEGSAFFGNFTTEDHGGLNAIITAPLNTIRSLLNSSCTKLTLPLPYVNKNIELPCMNDIYTEHFGLFFSLYQTIILAIISYRCLRSIFFDITGFTNPDDDRIEVMDL